MEKKDSDMFSAFHRKVTALLSVAQEASDHPEKRNDSGWSNRMADAANEVFLARDAITDDNAEAWDRVIQDMERVGEVLDQYDVVILSEPQTTSTGKKTYKIINKPSRNG